MSQPTQRILLGHLAAFGDCLYATVLARQIKHDFPGCHLTWAIASPFRELIDGNPYVDEIWEVHVTRLEAMTGGWRGFVRDATERQQKGDFDRVFFTQIPPDNVQNFDGTVRASIFNGYPGPITVPLRPVLRLHQEEVERVRRFAEEHGLAECRHVILFECAGLSGQTFVTQPFAIEAAKLVLETMPDACVILSSAAAFTSPDPRIIDASGLRFRENAELTRYATLFVGCSSGITWLSTADWSRSLPTIQLLRRATSIYASMVHDAQHFGLPSGHIIEMTECTTAHLAGCITGVLTDSFAEVHKRYHEQIRVDHQFYFSTFFVPLLKRGAFRKAAISLSHVIRRYGFRAVTNTFTSTFEGL